MEERSFHVEEGVTKWEGDNTMLYLGAQLPISVAWLEGSFLTRKGVFVAYILLYKSVRVNYDTFGKTLIFALNETIPQ